MVFERKNVPEAVRLLGGKSGIIRFVAAAEGMGDCEAWLDDPASPGIGAIRYEGKLYLTGSLSGERSSAALKDLLLGTVVSSMLEGHALGHIPVRIFDPHLGEKALALLAGMNVCSRRRDYLEASLPIERSAHRLPGGYFFRDVDGELLSDNRISGIELIQGECAYRHDCMGALGNAYMGLAAMSWYDVAGWCLSEYTCSAGAEVGIEVLEGHRRLGIAKAMASEYLQRASNRGIPRIGWHCYSDNAGSYRTAIACGFVHILSYDEFDIIPA